MKIVLLSLIFLLIPVALATDYNLTDVYDFYFFDGNIFSIWSGTLRTNSSDNILNINNTLNVEGNINATGNISGNIIRSGSHLIIGGASASTSYGLQFHDTGGEEWRVDYGAGKLEFLEIGVANDRLSLKDGGGASFGMAPVANWLSSAWTLAAPGLTTTGSGIVINAIGADIQAEGFWIKDQASAYRTLMRTFPLAQTADRTLNWHMNNQDQVIYLGDGDIRLEQDTLPTSNVTYNQVNVSVNITTPTYCIQGGGCTNSFDDYLTNGTNEVVYLGKVGIGTANPSVELDVQGTINVSKVRMGAINLTPTAAATPAEIILAGDGKRTLNMQGDLSVSGTSSINQNVGTGGSPDFVKATANNLRFDGDHDIETVFRGGYLLGFQAQDSGWQMTWEIWNADGDGTDNSNFDIWAHGVPTDLSNYELMQIGYITNANEALRYYKISSTAVNDGTVYPLELFTGANRGQIKLTSGGEVYMAQAVDDALGNLRATYWDSATGQLGYDSSSARYKENVEDMPDEISDKIHQLRPVTYDKIGGAKDKFGLTAEEVNELYPQCVFYKREPVMGICIDSINNSEYECIESYKLSINKTTRKKIPEGINYDCLITPLIQEVQNLKERIEILESAKGVGESTMPSNLYECPTTGIVKECIELSNPNTSGKQTRCYQNIEHTNWYVCNAGWVNV